MIDIQAPLLPRCFQGWRIPKSKKSCKGGGTWAQLELNLAREVSDKKGFLKYVSSKRKAMENVGALLYEVGASVMESTQGNLL